MLRCWTKKMNCIILKSKWHRWQSHHLEEIPKSRANPTDVMRNAKRITFKFFFHVTKLGQESAWSQYWSLWWQGAGVQWWISWSGDHLLQNINCLWQWSLGAGDFCCTSGLDVVLAFAASEAGPKEWDMEPQAKLLQDYLCQTGNYPAQHQCLP